MPSVSRIAWIALASAGIEGVQGDAVTSYGVFECVMVPRDFTVDSMLLMQLAGEPLEIRRRKRLRC